MLSLLDRYLQRMGYAVTPCANRAAALAAFETDPHSFDGAVIDFTLPDGHGEELAAALRASAPRLKVLFTSGHPSASGGGSSAFLQKPFLPDALREALGKLLPGEDRATGGGRSAP